MATIIKPSGLYGNRASFRKTYLNAAVAVGANANMLIGLAAFHCYLGGFVVRALTGCLVTISSGGAVDFIELNLIANTDFVLSLGDFPMRTTTAGHNWAIRHNQAAPVTIISTAWGIVGD